MTTENIECWVEVFKVVTNDLLPARLRNTVECYFDIFTEGDRAIVTFSDVVKNI